MKKRLLVLYAANSVHTSTVKDYLNAFKEYSNYEVFFADAVQDAQLGIPFACFDYVLVHYSVRLSYSNYISKHVAEELRSFRGVKALTIQDEYESTATTHQWIKKIGFDLVFTCVPQQFVENVYPRAMFPDTKFVTVLTGYVPEWLTEIERAPIASRNLDIVYRGRRLHYFYGRLGREKELIGVEVKKEALAAGLNVDIETNDEHRIYGDAWFDFLRSSKTTLASESGANIFDFDGTIRRQIDNYLKQAPLATFEEVESKLLSGLEGKYAIMNQVSPKMFEAIACGTVLVMYEGEYSGILEADKHFICLKKDMSNWSEVLKKIRDPQFLTMLSSNAYDDIIASEKWSYKNFVGTIDAYLIGIRKEPANEEFAPKNRTVAYVGGPRLGGQIANCFDVPVDHNFLAAVRNTGANMRRPKLTTLIVPGFDLAIPGEWVRLVWVILVPKSLRLKLSRQLKDRVRSLFGLYVEH